MITLELNRILTETDMVSRERKVLQKKREDFKIKSVNKLLTSLVIVHYCCNHSGCISALMCVFLTNQLIFAIRTARI